jgi:predicted DCC family thiol-disulfide oxidoreductase YuxK
MNKKNETTLIFFDELCPFCTKWTKLLIKYSNNKFLFSPLSSKFAKKRLALNPDLNTIELNSLLIIKNDQILKEGAAIKEIVKELHSIGFIIKICLILPESILSIFYRLIARNRVKLFGRYLSCPLALSESIYLINE